MKQFATHAHFFLSILAVIVHFADPPSMPVDWVLGTIGITFALALCIPPFGMLKPDELVSSDKKTLLKHGFHESAAKVASEEIASTAKETDKTK